ncbi:MAG: glycosyltransferase [Pseudomonadota bacterium]
MKRRNPLKLLFYLNVLIVVFLIGYKAYLNYFLSDFNAEHTEQLAQLEERLEGKDDFSFAVVGNINNSVGIFERKIVPMLNESDIDFMVSAGNAVSGGGEDKYRALHGSLSNLEIPYLLTFGENEYEDFGSFRFYEHFGPHFYSVVANNSRLIFLDSTGKTPFSWQHRWLEDILEADESDHVFVFVGHPLFEAEQSVLFGSSDAYWDSETSRLQLLDLIQRHEVDAVFSANLPLYSQQSVGDTEFITTGGAGGLILNNDVSFHHFIRVNVTPEDFEVELVPLDIGQHPILKQLESFWFFIYSLFYVGYQNFILLVSVLTLIAIRLYTMIFLDRDYYPDYDIDPSPWLDKPLRVAMFTNNYLPFIGGVPISIARLRRGLEALGNRILVIAPRYSGIGEEEENTLYVPSLLPVGRKREFRMANIFLPGIRRRVREFKPDIIHLHHPFWLGSLGLFMARRMRIPAIYTYHTRLEHYAHFVPVPGRLFRNFISHALVKRFANKCDGIIVPTSSAEEYLRMIGVKRDIFVQPTGIEFEHFQDVDRARVKALRKEFGIKDEVVLISVSRISLEKNIDFMLDALADLRQRIDQPFRLLLIGEGDQQPRLQRRLNELGLSDCCTLVGSVPPKEMPNYYGLGDIFVFASKSETQGMVILEAMASGLPVVAVRSSGIDDVVRQDYNGFKTREVRDQWRDAVSRLMQERYLRETLGRQAREFSRGYSVEHFAEEVKAVYAKVLATLQR